MSEQVNSATGQGGRVEIGGEVSAGAGADRWVENTIANYARSMKMDGLLRIDGSLCLDLLPLEYYGNMHRVIQGPLYDPTAIDRDRVYETTTIGGLAPDHFATFYQRVTPDWGKP